MEGALLNVETNRKSLAELAAQFDVHPQQITTWNADKEERLTKIVSLQAQVGEQAKRLKGG